MLKNIVVIRKNRDAKGAHVADEMARNGNLAIQLSYVEDTLARPTQHSIILECMAKLYYSIKYLSMAPFPGIWKTAWRRRQADTTRYKRC